MSYLTTIVHRRLDSGFERETYLGHEAVVPLPEIGCNLPLADLYEGIEFPSAALDKCDD